MVKNREEKYQLLKELVQIDLEEGSMYYLLLDYLLQTMDDINLFISKFYDGNTIRSIELFRRYKRQQVKMTLEEFKQMWQDKKKQALERLFQEPVSDSMLEVVRDFNLDHFYNLAVQYKTHTFKSITKKTELNKGIESKYKNEVDFLFV